MTATRARRGRPADYGPVPQSERAARATSRRNHVATSQQSSSAAAPADEWLTVEEICTELKISRRTFDRWRARPRHWAAVRTARWPWPAAHTAKLARRLGRERPRRRMNSENWSYDVKFWNTDIRENRRTPYRVRWVVAGQVFSDSFTTSGLADGFPVTARHAGPQRRTVQHRGRPAEVTSAQAPGRVIPRPRARICGPCLEGRGRQEPRIDLGDAEPGSSRGDAEHPWLARPRRAPVGAAERPQPGGARRPALRRGTQGAGLAGEGLPPGERVRE